MFYFNSAVITSSLWIQSLSWHTSSYLQRCTYSTCMLTFLFLSFLLCPTLFPSSINTTRCLSPALSDPPFLCGRMGWGHSSTQWLCAKRGKSAGLIRPSLPMTKISSVKRVSFKNSSVSVSKEYLLFTGQRLNDDSSNVVYFFLLSTNPMKRQKNKTNNLPQYCPSS